MKDRILFGVALAGQMLVGGLSAFAQVPPPGGGSVGAPLDSFSIALIVLAVIFSVWRLTHHKVRGSFNQ
jgi:hypothetical protein